MSRSPFGSLARLASAVPLFRPGSSLPGANAPLVSAPDTAPTAQRSHGATLRRSLRYACVEGMLAEAFTACVGGSVLTGWALFLKLSPFWIGVLGALPFIAQLVQLPAATFTSWLGHKRVAVASVALSRQVYLPLVALPFLPIPLEAKQQVLVAVAAASGVLGVIGNNAWVSWMGELVPVPIRGRYFGKRSALCILGGTLASLAAGAGLDFGKADGRAGLAFSRLALVACVAGALTTVMMARQHDPAPGASRVPPGLRAALQPLRDPLARRVIAFQVAWNLAIGVAAAFFSVHMLRNLHLGFTVIALYSAGVAAVRMLSAPAWGRALDRVGTRPVLTACCFGMALVPLLWLLPTPNRLWPLAVDCVLSGVLWCGQGLASFQLPLAVAPRENRPFYLAVFATVGGVAFALASAAGGELAEQLPRQFTWHGHEVYGLHALFLLSAVGRFLAGWVGMRIVEDGAGSMSELLALTREGVRLRLRLPTADAPELAAPR